MNHLKLPVISKSEYMKRLRARKYEDLDALRSIEAYFLKSRGFVYKTPKPQTPVVLLLSGGLDSMIAWALLIERYGLDVYPLFAANRQIAATRIALSRISRFFKQHYPSSYRPPTVVTPQYMPPELKLTAQHFHPKQLVHFFNVANSTVFLGPLAGTNALTAMTGYLYTRYLKLTKNLNIQTIYCGIAAGDGTVVQSQTLTSMRSMMLLLSLFGGEKHLQYSSIFLEKETGIFMEKYQEIQIGAKLGLPLYDTYSCSRGGRFHCGECITCHSRKLEFRKAGIEDRTEYWLPSANWRYHAMFLLKKLFHSVYNGL